MMKLPGTLLLLSVLALTACDSSSSSVDDGEPAAGSDGGIDGTGGGGSGDGSGSGGSGDGDGSGGGGDGSGGDGDSGSGGSGDGDGGGGDGGSDGDGGGVTCVPPTHGRAIVQGSTALTDGCVNDGAGVAAANTAGLVFEADLSGGAVPADFPADVKGLYFYTENSAPSYLVPFSADGYFYRAKNWGFVTRGPGVYYLALSDLSGAPGQVLNGLQLQSQALTGDKLNVTEVRWAHVDDDVSALPKMHWQHHLHTVSTPSGPATRPSTTRAASGHPLRGLTHALSVAVSQQYLTLQANGCAPQALDAELPSIRFIDVTGELGQAWTGHELDFHGGDDLREPTYMVAVDWDYADSASVADIVASFAGEDYLWPTAEQLAGTGASCPPITVDIDIDALRTQVLDGTAGVAQDWQH